MRKPDPTRFTGRRKRKPDKLEMRGFSDTPPPEKAKAEGEEGETERSSVRKSERTDQRTEKRTVSLPVRRRTKRYSFEFYDDQLTKLKRLKYQAEMAGENLSLSEMVRQALDEYLKDR